MAKLQEDLQLYTTLETNQANVKTQIDAYVALQPLEVDRDKLDEKITKALAANDYTAAIAALAELQDAKRGIVWSEDTGTHVRIRDGRAVNDELFDDHSLYKIQLLNQIRAAQLLAETSKREFKPEEYNKLITEFDTQPDNREIINQKLIALVAKDLQSKPSGWTRFKSVVMRRGYLEYDYDKAAKMLDRAKDYTGLDDEHYHIVTLTIVKGKTVFEADVAMMELTAAQKAEYKQIEKIDEQLTGPKWFKALKPWEQELVFKYKDDIVAGNKVIPTQLRRIIGARNAYLKQTGLIEGDKAVVKHRAPHSGAVATAPMPWYKVMLGFSNKEGQRGANLNTQQLSSALGKKVHLTTLNATANPQDSEFVTQAAEAARATGNSHGNFTFNILRKFFANKEDDTNQFLTNLAEKLNEHGDKAHLNPIAHFLKTGEEKAAATAALEGLNPDSKTMLAEAIKLREKIPTNTHFFTGIWTRLFDSENRNLEITTSLSIMADKLNNSTSLGDILTREQQEALQQEFVIQCASGKDRTGLAVTTTTATVVTNEIGVGITLVEVMQATAKTAHSQTMASTQGGTPGCMGLKEETRAGMPKNTPRDIQDQLIRETAQSNKVKYKPKKMVEALAQLKGPIKAPDKTTSRNLTVSKAEEQHPPVVARIQAISPLITPLTDRDSEEQQLSPQATPLGTPPRTQGTPLVN